MKKHYINAVTQLLLQGRDVDAVLKNLERVLKAKGHESIHAAILEGVLAVCTRARVDHAPMVTLARKGDHAALTSALETALESLGAQGSQAQVTVDPTLIGGYTSTYKGKLIDSSYKQKLVSLYRSITK